MARPLETPTARLTAGRLLDGVGTTDSRRWPVAEPALSRPTLEALAARLDHQAELTTLRWVAIHLVESHDRHQAQLAEAYPSLALPMACACPLCRQARPFVVSAEPREPTLEATPGADPR